MKTLRVDLGDRSYPIHIGPELLGNAEYLLPCIRGQQVMIVSNETVAPLYLERVKSVLADYQTAEVILPDGEEYKTLEIMNRVISALLEARFDRGCTLIALGGGVIGDMTGFAAACYQRGVEFIQIPTTLLAQVDSSVGGKTAVNHPLGKNMIGAFHQPVCVLADTASLNTLDDRQYSAGLAEVIKYGLIRDAEFYDWLKTSMDALLDRDIETINQAVEVSCRNKAELVAEDEREGGVRALLNLGHTFGHAIETGMGYGVWLHGEAVAAGMYMAADLSARMGWMTGQEVQSIGELLERARLPVRAPAELDVETMLKLMAVDKKAKAGRMRLVLLKGIGQGVISDDFEQDALLQTLTECRSAPQQE